MPLANRCQATDRTLKGKTLFSESRLLTNLKLELAYFSGLARWKPRGVGVILRFERVRPRHAARFQPLRSREITPDFLDRIVRALKRWEYDIISMNEVCRRAVTFAGRRRFVCLTFDGGYKDVMSSAYPVLSRHGVPFTRFGQLICRTRVIGAARVPLPGRWCTKRTLDSSSRA